MAFDIVGSADDSVAGGRIRVFGAPSVGGLTLQSAELTTFCQRGVDPSGRCA